MAATSQNGFSANDRSVIATYTVPGTTLRIPLRKGDVSVVLLEYLRRYHLEVESLYNQPQDLWGYASRTIRGSSTTLSNHASGTAVDARAVKNGLGMRGTFTTAQTHALDRLLAYFEGALRHGRSYSKRPDPMHAEINAGAAAVKRIADKIRSGVQPTIPAVPGGPGMPLTTDQDRKLTLVFEQLTGAGSTTAKFEGWTGWGGGTGEKLTAIDYMRRSNVEVRVLRNEHNAAMAAMRAEVSALAKQVGELVAAVRAGGSAAPAEFTITGTARPAP